MVEEGETETITEKIVEAFFMFKVLGWGGGCGGGSHMEFSNNSESKLPFPNWGSIRLGLGLGL